MDWAPLRSCFASVLNYSSEFYEKKDDFSVNCQVASNTVWTQGVQNLLHEREQLKIIANRVEMSV